VEYPESLGHPVSFLERIAATGGPSRYSRFCHAGSMPSRLSECHGMTDCPSTSPPDRERRPQPEWGLKGAAWLSREANYPLQGRLTLDPATVWIAPFDPPMPAGKAVRWTMLRRWWTLLRQLDSRFRVSMPRTHQICRRRPSSMCMSLRPKWTSMGHRYRTTDPTST